jgi:anaerobic ribonucleoside-triphosphate reductase
MKGGRPDSVLNIQLQEEDKMSNKCSAKTEVYSRVCGFFRPVQQWNKGKKEEFKDRREYVVENGK